MIYLTHFAICVLAGIVPFLTFAQSGRVIKTPTKYFQEGVIFDSLTDNAPLPSNPLMRSVSRFTPTIEEITIAEEMINTGYDNKYIKLKNCYRQYFGYTDKQRNRVIIVQLINTDIKGKERSALKDWKTESKAGFGDFYEKNVRRYFVDISHHKFLWNLG